jgi:hypothetical protein
MAHQTIITNLIRDNILSNLDLPSILSMMSCCKRFKANLELMIQERRTKKEEGSTVILSFLGQGTAESFCWFRTFKKEKNHFILHSDKLGTKEVIYGKRVWLEKEVEISRKRIRVQIPEIETISDSLSLKRFSNSIEIDGIKVTLVDNKVQEVNIKGQGTELLIILLSETGNHLQIVEVKINLFKKGEQRDFSFNQTNFHRPMIRKKFEKTIRHFGVTRFFSYDSRPKLTDTFFSRFRV